MFLCGQMSGLAAIALWAEASIDHTGLAHARQLSRQCSPQCLCQVSRAGFLLAVLGPVTTVIMWNVGFPGITLSLGWIVYSVLL